MNACSRTPSDRLATTNDIVKVHLLRDESGQLTLDTLSRGAAGTICFGVANADRFFLIHDVELFPHTLQRRLDFRQQHVLEGLGPAQPGERIFRSAACGAAMSDYRRQNRRAGMAGGGKRNRQNAAFHGSVRRAPRSSPVC